MFCLCVQCVRATGFNIGCSIAESCVECQYCCLVGASHEFEQGVCVWCDEEDEEEEEEEHVDDCPGRMGTPWIVCLI